MRRRLTIAAGLSIVSMSACVDGRQLTPPHTTARPLRVEGAAVDGSLLIASFRRGVLSQVTLSAQGGTGQYVWSVHAGSMPTGLRFSSVGVLEGTPSDTGSVTMVIRVTSGVQSLNTDVTLRVQDRLEFVTSLRGAVLGTPYHDTLSVNRDRSLVSYRVIAGSLPDGIELGANGVLRGTPQSRAAASVSIEATYGNERITTNGSLVVVAAPTHTLPAGVVNLRDPRQLSPSNAPAVRSVLIEVPASSQTQRTLLSVSPDFASDSLVGYPARMPGSAIVAQVRIVRVGQNLSAEQLAATAVPTIPWSQQAPGILAERIAVPTERSFCAGGWGIPCPVGTLSFQDSLLAYYEDPSLTLSQRGTTEFWNWVRSYNKTMDSIVGRIWGPLGDVDGDRRVSVYHSNRVAGFGNWFWNPCMGPGPAPANYDCTQTLFERMNTGTVGGYIAEFGARAAAALFVHAQSTDFQEVLLFSNFPRYPGTRVDGSGAWASRARQTHAPDDRVFGNGFSHLANYIWSDGGQSLLADGQRFDQRSSTGLRWTCLNAISKCTVNWDTYQTPGAFSYWLWQLLGDGIGRRYADTQHLDFNGDFWEQALGMRGGFLFNWFFLSSYLDGTSGEAATPLRWPRTNLRAHFDGYPTDGKFENPRTVTVGTETFLTAPYSGADVIEIVGTQPGGKYVVEIEYLSSVRIALTAVVIR